MRKLIYAIATIIVLGAMGITSADGAEKADLVGVWSAGKAYMWLYEDRSMKALRSDCSHMELGTWKFEMGTLSVYVGGKRVISNYILKVPANPKIGDKMVLDTTREWLFMGRDTNMKC